MRNFAPQIGESMNLPHHISGEVVRGNRIGRQLGFPTANIRLGASDEVVNGVYAVRAVVDGALRNGVASVGCRPTVTDNPERFLEVYLFDFSGDIYGVTMKVELVAYIRAERKFASVEALRQQIEEDKKTAEKILAEAAH
ncbi:riboflavin kinase [Alistipes sp. OttesenSCG-928-L06]|nr:riboflavin kinase [Alistipes sp. OttesenSCG-928-L06]